MTNAAKTKAKPATTQTKAPALGATKVLGCGTVVIRTKRGCISLT